MHRYGNYMLQPPLGLATHNHLLFQTRDGKNLDRYFLKSEQRLFSNVVPFAPFIVDRISWAKSYRQLTSAFYFILEEPSISEALFCFCGTSFAQWADFITERTRPLVVLLVAVLRNEANQCKFAYHCSAHAVVTASVSRSWAVDDNPCNGCILLVNKVATLLTLPDKWIWFAEHKPDRLADCMGTVRPGQVKWRRLKRLVVSLGHVCGV